MQSKNQRFFEDSKLSAIKELSERIGRCPPRFASRFTCNRTSSMAASKWVNVASEGWENICKMLMCRSPVNSWKFTVKEFCKFSYVWRFLACEVQWVSCDVARQLVKRFPLFRYIEFSLQWVTITTVSNGSHNPFLLALRWNIAFTYATELKVKVMYWGLLACYFRNLTARSWKMSSAVLLNARTHNTSQGQIF